jgi:hypothetical protein
VNDLSFCRTILKATLEEVRAAGLPQDKIKSAWVWKTFNQWEFHFGDFYWWGKAENAYDARDKGWSAWLAQQEVAK